MVTKNLLKPETYFRGYRILRLLSTNHESQREVYKAVAADMRPAVVIVYRHISRKRRKGETLPQYSSVEDRYDEIRFIKTHQHLPSVPRYLDSGYALGYCRRTVCWIAVEEFNGLTLDSILKDRSFSFSQATSVFYSLVPLLSAVAAFTGGGGHYNLSTSNILVEYGDENRVGNILVTGFSNLRGSMTKAPSRLISALDPRILPPEAAKGILSKYTDIFSLAVVLMAMLTGLPREGDELIAPPDPETGAPPATAPEDYSGILMKSLKEKYGNLFTMIVRCGISQIPERRFHTPEKFAEFVRRTSDVMTQFPRPSERSAESPASQSQAAGVVADESESAVSSSTSAQTGKIGGGLDEVAGLAELKALFRRDFIGILKNPEVARAYGIKPGNCTLLYGPQGCGKTFIAERAARESGLKYKIINPSELASIYIHGSQEKIAEAFNEAEKNGPMILIFDEFDALVPRRDMNYHNSQANEVNEMLTQLNNCAERGIFVIGTTNRPALIDPAVMRKGRVDHTVYVPLPDFEARRELFRIELSRRPLAGEIDYDRLSMATENFTCSDIAYIVEEVARTCFENTVNRNLSTPEPITMEALIATVSSTVPSVSEEQRKEYLTLKAEMENNGSRASVRKVGFSLPVSS